MNLAPLFKGATGGISDDIFVGIADSFQADSNLDIYSAPNSIKLNKALVSESGEVITETINTIIKLSTGQMMAFGSSGGIYRKATTTWTKNSNSAPTAILSAIEYNSNLYFTTATGLYEIAIASLSDSMVLPSPETLNSSSYHPMVEFNGILVIGNATVIAEVDNLGVFTDDLFTGNYQGTVRYLQTLGGNVKIYYDYEKLNKTDILYRDGVTEAPVDSISFGGIRIDQLINKQGIDYVIIGNQFGVIDGYRIIKLKEINTSNTASNSISIYNNKILFGGDTNVYEWGSLNKNYPEVLNNGYTASGTVYAIFSDSTDVYVSRKDGLTYGIDKLGTSYATTGSLTTRAYYGSARVLEKTSVLIKSAFNKLVGTDELKIYYRYDFATSFTLLTTYTATSGKLTDYYDNFPIDGEWNFIEIKIELTSGDGTTTPEVYECYLGFNDIKVG